MRILFVFIFLAPLVAVKEVTHDHEDDLGGLCFGCDVGGNYFVVGRLISLPTYLQSGIEQTNK